MTIEPGRSLLHYRLLAEIGAGGMGAVWKALDTSLNREVAIKILPVAFAADQDRLARFEREARLLASLNHPNVASIYGIHEAEGVRFLAMELVEGEDLSQRLARGALPREEALRVALDVARGFEAAHEKGVIHRDLKPANVKLTADGAVKVLDFGLAKALAADASDPAASLSMSPTLTSAGTVAGMILGTAAYMSPEQAKGKPVDRRADIWSFGVVLFEMLAGRRLFEGETVSETLAAVLMKDADWSALPAGTPAAVRRLLQRCLQRDPRSRLRDIGDARIVLEEALQSPRPVADVAAPTKRSRGPAWLPWVVAAGALVALAVVVLRAPAREPLGVMRLRLAIPEQVRGALAPIPMLALSPDGRRLAFVGRDEEDDDLLYLRTIDQPDAVALPGTEDAEHPIFSPDSRSIAFAQDGKFKKMSIEGGPPVTLCDAPMLRGASWGAEGSIVFAPDRIAGLMRVSDAGGTPEPLTTLERDPDSPMQPSHRWPEMLPGGRTVLFTATDNDSDYTDARIVALSLDDLSQRVLVEHGSYPRYVPAGFLVFARAEGIFAARFDPEAVKLLGPAVPVLEDAAYSPFYGDAQLTFSNNGVLAYMQVSERGAESTLVWVDREGRETAASEQTGQFGTPRLSPDGSLIAVEVRRPPESSIWLVELERDTATRLSFDSRVAGSPLWSPDGEWIVYDSLRDGASRNLFRKRANGTGESERLTRSPRHQYPYSFTPDGKTLAFTEIEGETGADIFLLHLDGEPRTEVFLKTPFNEGMPAISPDGRFLAYTSNESGKREIYVLPLGGAGGRTKISTAGGFWPRWAPDGKELLYTADDKLMSVRVSLENGVLRPQLPREVIPWPDEYENLFDVSRDGQRLLVVRESGTERAAPEPAVVIGWFDELDARVPKER